MQKLMENDLKQTNSVETFPRDANRDAYFWSVKFIYLFIYYV